MRSCDGESEPEDGDSLFGSDDSHADSLSNPDSNTSLDASAAITPPPIPGLYMFPRLLPEDTASKLVQEIARSDIFCGGQRNQAMLFTSAQGSQLAGSTSGFPTYLQELSSTLEDLLAPHLDKDTMSTLFHPFSANASSRQIILNLYRPGEGITPHIDLPGRYADGIMGVCLGSGCVMDFERPETSEVASKYSVYMPARTIYCMTGDARWKWAHGIPSRDRDVVADAQGQIRTILRDVRISITLRWMKPGAEVLQ